MIFVMVGTHEQQFNRLVRHIDELKACEDIQDSVFLQTGYSTYIPKSCDYEKLMSFDAIEQHIARADVVITHGGPATFMDVLGHGKVPIVVPRQAQFGEHVNDHQLGFTQKVAERGYPIKIVVNMADLLSAINEVGESGPIDMHSHNKEFNGRLRIEIDNLLRRAS